MHRVICSGLQFASLAACLAVAAAGLSACSADFSQRVANHPGCVGDAQIARWKADQCMSYGGVSRDAFDNCLAERGVPRDRIRMLNECVQARSNY